MRTTLDRLRERAEEVVRRDPAVDAVVLFGSRARGTATSRSDWDVALIEKNGRAAETMYRLLGDLPGVHPFGIGTDAIERHKDTAGALEAALVRQGLMLAGAWKRPVCREEALGMDMVRVRASLANATDQVDIAVRAGIEHLYATGRRRVDWTPLTTGSADAAEHLAKAIVTGHGLSPREVHFLDALAEQLKSAYRGRDDPQQAYWAERIRVMNGATRTRRLHDAGYWRFLAPAAEPLERSVERLGQVQRTQILWLREMTGRWPDLAGETADAAREIVAKGRGFSGLRAGFTGEPVTAGESTRATITRLETTTADWIESAGALLARIEGRETAPFEPQGDEPPQRDVPRG